MQRLDCHVKEYTWGKRGVTSEVARLFAAGHKKFRIGPKTPYAELWMGTHPDGPARVQDTAERLSSLIARSDSSSYLLNNNGKSADVDEVHLAFIMKIMSIDHTLSLQVHPTKEQAARLHKSDPLNYPDRNHKPELAYALTRFELLCGFRPAVEILENMKAFPELSELMGYKKQQKFERLVQSGVPQESTEMRLALRGCFKTMMYASPDVIAKQLASLKARIASGVRGCLIEDTIKVMEQTWTLFPNDVGCFAPLYLNHMILQPGQCCFYEAEELHAYLSGECVECVGCSNNTIRAGLTPKFVDRENLIDVLNYRMTDPSFYMVPRTSLDGYDCVSEYAPNCKDFTLHQVDLPSQRAPHAVVAELPVLNCASIIVIVSGDVECQELIAEIEPSGRQGEWGLANLREGKRGDIFYIPPQSQVRLIKRGDEDVLAYRTFSYEVGPDHASRIKLPTNDVATKIAMPIRTFDHMHNGVADYIDKTIEMDGFI
ncbi:Mannose-6-phosphate isomerase domain containing protein [Aphelenchoides besseyi]|nr:Mannose-6-phosphate isomerase domain containing protein [Aphelenchoides besseyi]KAI6199739.1 Mannose-6-phosphate isomerase domain containing protein [Aphelenchoides besseyi]